LKFFSKNELIEITVEDDARFISRALTLRVLPVDGPGHHRKARERQGHKCLCLFPDSFPVIIFNLQSIYL